MQKSVGVGVNLKLIILTDRQEIQAIAISEPKFRDRFAVKFFWHQHFYNAVV